MKQPPYVFGPAIALLNFVFNLDEFVFAHKLAANEFRTVK